MENIYPDIISIFETNKITEVNEGLSTGWIYLNSVSRKDREDILYSLGWSASKGEIISIAPPFSN